MPIRGKSHQRLQFPDYASLHPGYLSHSALFSKLPFALTLLTLLAFKAAHQTKQELTHLVEH